VLASSGAASAAKYGAASITTIASTLLQSAGIRSPSAGGQASIAVTLRPAGAASTSASGAASIARVLTVPGIASRAAAGAASIGPFLQPAGAASKQAAGAASIAPTLRPAGAGSRAGYGSASIGTITLLSSAGIRSDARAGASRIVPVPTVLVAFRGQQTMSHSIQAPTRTVETAQEMAATTRNAPTVALGVASNPYGSSSVINSGGVLMGACTTSVPSIAVLKTLPYSTFCTGDLIWVQSLKTLYLVDKLSLSAAEDGLFCIKSTDGVALLVRQLLPTPYWQQAATNGTGMFLDPVAGNDEADALTSGTPIASMREFCARMWGAVFTVSPRLTIAAGAGSVSAADAIVWGFRCATNIRFLIIGTPTVLAGSVSITAAADLNPAVSAGFLTSTTTDFNGLGYVSTPTRSLFARRANTSGGQATYAPLMRTHNSGGNFSVDIAKQSQVNATTLVSAATSQLFAPGDAVDLITLPAWPNLILPTDVLVSAALLDFAGGSTFDGLANFISCGFRTLFGVAFGQATAFGCQFTGGITGQTDKRTFTLRSGMGAMGANSNRFATNLSQDTDFTMERCAIGDGGVTAHFSLSGGWTQNTIGPAIALSAGSTCLILAPVGSGLGVPSAASVGRGSRILHAAFFTDVAGAWSATPWAIGATAYATAALPVNDTVYDAGVFLV
jgi:hypothetical protein